MIQERKAEWPKKEFSQGERKSIVCAKKVAETCGGCQGVLGPAGEKKKKKNSGEIDKEIRRRP